MNQRTRVLALILVLIGAVVIVDRYVIKDSDPGVASTGAGEESARAR